MTLRQIMCALLGHRFRYSGMLLGSRMERCERCGKHRAQ
jgi:hypothetical protein